MSQEIESRDCRVRGQSVCRASEASTELRSEATQRVSSLDEVQNNCNTYESIFLNTASGRGKSCGRFTLVGISSDRKAQRYIRLDCKCWNCSYCGPKKAGRYRNAIREVAEAHKLCRFLTLTLDPRLIFQTALRTRSAHVMYFCFLRKMIQKRLLDPAFWLLVLM